MTFEEWEETAPRGLRAQAFWRVMAYRRGAYLAALVADDVRPLVGDVRFGENLEQLVSAVGSIGANISEGYARRTRADRIKYYEYALKSANESIHWYLTVSCRLTRDLIEDPLDSLGQVCRLLLTMIKNERRGGGWNDSRRIPP